MDYIKSRLTQVFSDLGISLEFPKVYASLSVGKQAEEIKKYDFALFFDKDIPLARFFERCGVRVFNSSRTLMLCDDKELTYSAAAQTGVKIPKSIFSPLMYDVDDIIDETFLYRVKSALSFPLIIKENVGSQGRQVYLAHDETELTALYMRLKRTPHLYQEFIDGTKGSDTRVYVIGKKAVFAVRRENTTDFRSNVSLGGKMQITELKDCLVSRAEKIAEKLGLEYGSVDFLGNEADVFLEANSNAYLKTAENLGANLAVRLAEYVTGQIYGTEK